MGFTSAVGFLFISPAPLPECAECDGAAFSQAKTSSASSVLAAISILPGQPDCCYSQRAGLTGAGSTPLLHHFYPTVKQTENLCSLSHASVSTSHSVLACFQLNLLFN